MVEDTIKKQTTIAALSNATILHDPTLVEDLSGLRNIPRISSDEADQSVSGSVVITKRIPPVGNESASTRMDNKNNENKQPRITSMASSHYSDDDNDDLLVRDHEVNVHDEEQNNISHHQIIEHSNGENLDQLESQLDEEISHSRDEPYTTIHSDHDYDYDSINQDVDQTQTEDLEYSDSVPHRDDEGENDGQVDQDEDEHDLNMEYSDSDFEDNLEQRMMHLDGDNETDSLNPSEKTVTPLHSGSTTPNYEYSDDEYDHTSKDNETSHNDQDLNNQLNISDNEEDENYGDEEEEEAEEDEDYQPLPPPQELDPEKLYALYAFNGPDPSHCQLEQDESCILLNDEDTYWWLVKRCRDNNIGFAPAELLETFPERLARLNCWKNENMTSSTVNSSQSIDIINQNEREQQEELETKKNSSLKLPYQTGKSDKSVSFNDIVSYANRYVENGSESDETVSDNNSDVVVNELSSKVKEDKKITKYNHIDKFTNEVISYNKRSDMDENNSDVVSDVSFNTGYTQPLNMVKIRESKSIKNIHNEIIDDAPKRHEEVNKWSDVKGLGISEVENPPEHVASDADIEDLENLDLNKTGDQSEDSKVDNEETDEQKSINTSTNELHKIFEAPIIPFGKDNDSKIKKSTSDYSISTIGEFSPSSSEWTNDSPNLKNTGNTEEATNDENAFNNTFESTNIPSTRAVQDISQLVEQSPSPKKNETDKVINEYTSGNLQDNQDHHASSPISHPNSSSSDTISSAEGEFKMYMEDGELQASTTSVTSNNSSHKNQTIGYISDLSGQKSTIKDTSITNSSFSSDQTSSNTYQHPLVQDMYNPILSKIDILMTKIDQIVQQ
ncbi:bud site selection protein 14 [Monosporozyma unispora]|nr:hypothetical protein C6P44_004500 [Kazachstania unispora]